jgi:hypothetical protein
LASDVTGAVANAGRQLFFRRDILALFLEDLSVLETARARRGHVGAGIDGERAESRSER